MINLNIEDKREQGRKSSKGNQLKFEQDGIWYKADYLGYEGLAEYVVSKLLSFSTMFFSICAEMMKIFVFWLMILLLIKS